MKVLIINGFSNTAVGEKSFRQFVSNVKKAFEYLYSCGMDEPNFVILDNSNINTYISLNNSKYDNTESARLFDSVDFIIIDGDANRLPWSINSYELGLLFKQCKRCDKALLAAGFAFYMLVYYCATNYCYFNIVNGHGWGTKLKEINNFPTEGLPAGAGFLDNETGDIYTHNNDTNSWVPMANS